MKDNIIVNSICEYIKGKILSKEMFPGYRIVEDELANELGVSRTPLRKALAELQHEGFLYIIPNRGTFVVQSSYEDIVKVYAARSCMEEGMAHSIIDNVTPDDIDELEKINEKINALVDNRPISDYAAMNREFFVRLASISDNEYLVKYIEEIHNRISMFLVYYDDSIKNSDSVATHTAIINALKNKDYNAYIKAIKADVALEKVEMMRSSEPQFTKLKFRE